MNALSSLFAVLCCLPLSAALCAPLSLSVSTTAHITAHQPYSSELNIHPATQRTISHLAHSPHAFTAFGTKPSIWSIVSDGPLLQIEHVKKDLVTLTTEHIHRAHAILFNAIDYTTEQQHNKVQLVLTRQRCVTNNGTYDLSAQLFIRNTLYTGCAVAGPVTTSD